MKPAADAHTVDDESAVAALPCVPRAHPRRTKRVLGPLTGATQRRLVRYQ